jgi:amphi-Trp domain-containing protein
MDKTLLQSKDIKTATEMAAFLRTLADKIETGRLTFTAGGSSVDLVIPKRLGFRLHVKDDIGRRTQRKVQIGFRWYHDQESGTEIEEGVGGVTIT